MRTATVVFTTFILFLTSCSEEKTSGSKPVISDSLFALHNIPNTSLVRNFWFDPEDNHACFADSTRKVKFTLMDSAQKVKYLIPFMGDIDQHYVIQFVDAYFISKQDTVGKFTPIVIKASGDDYDELMEILLDENGNPVSELSLYGGECGGPDDVGDSLTLNCPVRSSSFEKDMTNTYELHVYDRNDSIKRPSIIDSVTFISKISPDGKFVTTKKDSARYERMYNWEW